MNLGSGRFAQGRQDRHGGLDWEGVDWQGRQVAVRDSQTWKTNSSKSENLEQTNLYFIFRSDVYEFFNDFP